MSSCPRRMLVARGELQRKACPRRMLAARQNLLKKSFRYDLALQDRTSPRRMLAARQNLSDIVMREGDCFLSIFKKRMFHYTTWCLGELVVLNLVVIQINY
jgi:DNA-directed RNA polymerase subunit N (RpoN/RPB10)